MCTYLDQVGATYYFRRVVPAELRRYILTSSGASRTEWKLSLRTKDRETAKRELPGWTVATQAEIDRAAAALASGQTDAASESPQKPARRMSPQAEAMWAAHEQALRLLSISRRNLVRSPSSQM
ncbi:DUF6538 domain-containing protein [Sphingomonas bacterium]|uniref:DUF6538 domain-containing protein n=1 Tax=Sphingomonas bacterium TaxID=1895847 RepID=UPI002A17367D|nr:hypothetical protein [Sphingomonas bacterium]